MLPSDMAVTLVTMSPSAAIWPQRFGRNFQWKVLKK